MKIRYFKSVATNRLRRKEEKAERRRQHRMRIAKWHKKFAWVPLKISTPDDDNEYSTAVWFETVMQKGHIIDFDYPTLSKTRWTRYPEKEYFKKKLDGTLEPEEQFADFTHDSTNMSFQSAGASGVSKGGAVTITGGTSGPSAGPAK